MACRASEKPDADPVASTTTSHLFASTASSAMMPIPRAVSNACCCGCRATTRKYAPVSCKTCAINCPNRPAPISKILSVGRICTSSGISSAAASNSVKTAFSSDTESGTRCKFRVGSVTYSAKIPSRLTMPKTVRFSQCDLRPPWHCSQTPQLTLISPATRCPIQDSSAASITSPTNSCPGTPLKG